METYTKEQLKELFPSATDEVITYLSSWSIGDIRIKWLEDMARTDIMNNRIKSTLLDEFNPRLKKFECNQRIFQGNLTPPTIERNTAYTYLPVTPITTATPPVPPYWTPIDPLHMLQVIPWHHPNVVLAGGMASCLFDRAFFNHKARPLKTMDYDFFIYGTDGDRHFEDVVNRLVSAFLNFHRAGAVKANRSSHAITMTVSDNRNEMEIQIILRTYQSIFHILCAFDVDASCVAFTGTKWWYLERAERAFVTRSNLVDITRQSPTFEERLYKYAKKGFSIAIHGLDLSAVTAKNILSQTKPTGFIRLLWLCAMGDENVVPQKEPKFVCTWNSGEDPPPSGWMSELYRNFDLNHECTCRFPRDSACRRCYYPMVLKPGECRSFRPLNTQWFL